MNQDQPTGAMRADIAAALGERGVASLDRAGAPILVAEGDALRIIYANATAAALFSRCSFAEPRSRALCLNLGDGSEAATRIRALQPGANRVERFELSQVLGSEKASGIGKQTFLCRRAASAAPLYILAGLGLRPRESRPWSAPSAHPSEQSHATASSQKSFGSNASASPTSASEHFASDPLSSLKRDFEHRFPGLKPARFLWRTDSRNIVTELTPPLAEIVGGAAHDLVGRDLVEAVRTLGLDHEGRLAAALQGRVTFSGVELIWPIAGENAAAPVSLGALPAFDREKGFDGWRGFGVIALDRLLGIVRESAPTESAPMVEAHAASAHRSAPPLQSQDFSGASSGVVLPFPPPSPVRALSTELLNGREEDSALLVALAPHERNAFREIARTLGVHGEPDDPRLPAHLDDGEVPREHAISTAASDIAISPDDALFDTLPVGLAIRRQGNGPHVWLRANRTLLDWLGCEDNEAFLHAGGLDSFRRGGAQASDRDAMILHPQAGQSFPVDIETAPLSWGGAPAEALVFRRSSGNELRGRVAALETSLRQRETEAAEIMAMLEVSADGLVLFNSDGALLGLSATAEKLFGCARDQIVGENFASLFAPDSHPRLSEALAQLKSGASAPAQDLTGLAAAGETLAMRARFLRLDDVGAGKYCMVLRDRAAAPPDSEGGLASTSPAEKTSLVDTKSLLEAKIRAEAESRAKTEFLTAVTHEIRTPLNAILGFTEVIMDERFGPIGNARYKDYLKDIHASGAHVMSLVNDLLDLSKIESGKLQLDFSAVDVNQLVSECVSLIQPQANRERVITRLALSPRLPPALADARALRQIVLNLLANAVRYNEPGGQVIVSTTLVSTAGSKDAAIMLRVKDTGIGMSDAELRAALEPFRQVSSRTKGGTGLGLPLTKALTEANHANFVIRSRKNEGTLVEVALPLAPEAQEAPDAERTAEQAAR